MIKWIALLFFLIASLADVFIYRRVVCRYFRSFTVRITYILSAIVVDGAALSAFLYFTLSGGQSAGRVIYIMWIVWLFILCTLPKLMFVLGALFDWAAGRIAKRKVRIFRWLLIIASLAVAAVMIYGATVGRTRLKVREVEICSPDVPAAFDGYRIAQVSDLHIGTMLCGRRQTARLVEKVTRLAPDMIVHTGDLVNIDNTELTPELIEILARFDAPDGVFSVWGNHDLGFYLRNGGELTVDENFARLEAKVRETGWRVLSDESTFIKRGGDSILLTGLDYPRGTHHNGNNSSLAGSDPARAYAGVEGDPYNLVLAHTPVMWNDILETGHGDLTLSGHTHAMQMKLFLFGLTWSPAQYMYAEWSGKYAKKTDEKIKVLYINDGIGCVGYPMRIGAPPEVTLFILKRCE